MRFSYTLIALPVLLCFTGTALAQGDDAPPRHPQCPAPRDTQEVHQDASGVTAPLDTRVGESDVCDQAAPHSQACTEQSTVAASGWGPAQGQPRQLAKRRSRHEKARRGMTGKPRLRKRKNTVLRRPLSMRSILLYQRRRYNLALLEAQMDLQRRRASLAVSEQIGRMASKQGRGYELKAGNYWIDVGRPRWIFS